MTLGQAIIEDELPLVSGELEQTNLICKGRLCHAKAFCRLRLRAIPENHHIAQSLRLLERVQVFPLDVLKQSESRCPLIGIIAEDSRYLP